jgi:branched-chain amino acid transport system permease protein
VDALPDILRVPLSEPLFILGTLFILVVLFLPGGLTGTAQRLAQRRSRRSGDRVQKSREILEEAA